MKKSWIHSFALRSKVKWVWISEQEFDNLLFQIGRSSWGGRRTPPRAFTEQGVAMLSGVLHTDRAIKVNIHIMRVFTRMRELLIPNRDILQKLMDLESQGLDHDKKISLIFRYLEQLRETESERQEFKRRPKIGFKP